MNMSVCPQKQVCQSIQITTSLLIFVTNFNINIVILLICYHEYIDNFNQFGFQDLHAKMKFQRATLMLL